MTTDEPAPAAPEGGEDAVEPQPAPSQDADMPATFDHNRQRVGQGVSVGGGVTGGISVHFYAPADGEADDKVTKPRFREGPYPPEEITGRLRAFVAPPSYTACHDSLVDRQVLLLRGEAGSGTSTAALALLDDVTDTGRITGLDPSTDLTAWSPSAAGGYVLQGISQDAGARLDEVALRQLAEKLREVNAFLVVVVTRTSVLPRSATAWCKRHTPPEPADVASALLKAMADDEAISGTQREQALAKLADSPFKEYLAAGRSPGAGVEVAEELREVVAGGRTEKEAADNLQLGSAEVAVQLLDSVRRNPDDLALVAAVALLEEQDRSVVERLTVRLRPLLVQRLEPAASPAWADLLGRDFEDRLRAVQAKKLPRTVAVSGGGRYWTEPVAFRGRHLAEEVLRRLWLDYEGFSEVLLTWVGGLPYEPGLDRIAGRRIGQVLCRASGPDVLQQLKPFASSSLGWQRRLVGHALGEVVQDVVLSAAVRAQLRTWSSSPKPEPRCTVGETCAVGLGLALPDFALGLLDTVLAGDAGQLDKNVHNAVSAALGVLLTEHDNREKVFKRLTGWLREPDGTARHMYARKAVDLLCSSGFPSVNRAGVRKVRFADLFADDDPVLIELTLAALDDKSLFATLTTALTGLESSAGTDRTHEFLTSLSEASGGRQGLRSFLLARLRERSSGAADEEPR